MILLGVLTAAFTLVGSLEGITSFASLTFIVVFGAMSYLALGQRDHDDVSPSPPAIGLVGTVLFLPMMVWHLFSTQRGVFYTVAAITVVAVAVELVYFETDMFGYPPDEEAMAQSDCTPLYSIRSSSPTETPKASSPRPRLTASSTLP